MKNLNVVIIGGGMGGLTCGLFLLKSGHSVTLYEQAAEILPVGAAISLWSNGTRVMNVLGLGDKIRAMGGNMNRMVYCGVDSNKSEVEYMNLDLNNVYNQVGERCYPVPRAQLQSMLMDEYVKAGGKLHLGKCCSGVVEDSSTEKVTASFTDGSKSPSCDLLIGADGIKSKVRDYVIGEKGEVIYHYTNWNGLIPMSSDILPHKDEWRMWVAEGKRASVMPVSSKTNEQFYFFMGAPLKEGSVLNDVSKRRAELHHVFKNFPKNVHNLIDKMDIEKVNRIPISDLTPLSKYSKGNVVLLGDSAHGTTPTLGQGGCQAMEDAEVLSWFLNATNISIQDAFARYSNARKDRVHNMVLKARERTKTIYPTSEQAMEQTKAWYTELQNPATKTNIENGLINNMLGGPWIQSKL